MKKVVPCWRRRGMNAFGIPHICRKISQPKDVTPRIDSGIMLQSPTFTATFLEQYLEGILSELGSAKLNLEYRRCCRVVKVSAFLADRLRSSGGSCTLRSGTAWHTKFSRDHDTVANIM